MFYAQYEFLVNDDMIPYLCATKVIYKSLLKTLISSDRGSGRRPSFRLKATLTACAYTLLLLHKRRGMASFRHHFLGGYHFCSSSKPLLRTNLGLKKGVPFTACRISIWFDFNDFEKCLK